MRDTIFETVAAVESGEALNTSFSSTEPHLQLAHDSTSIRAGKKCWRYYKYSIIDGWTLGRDSDDLVFGRLFHSATELYDRLKAKGADHEEATQEVVKFCITATWDPALARPWVSETPTKTRNTLIQTTILYLDRYKDSHLKTLILANGKPAVEHSFRIDLDLKAPTGEPYLLCGHIDKAVVWNDNIRIPDKKTTKYALDDAYFRQFSPDDQMTIYTFAGKIIFSSDIDGTIIDAAQVLVNGSRFRRVQIDRSDEQIQEWFDGFLIYLKRLEWNVTNGFWPMNESACGFGRMQCVYRAVCSSDPSVRDEILKNHYQKRSTWNPKQPRGETL